MRHVEAVLMVASMLLLGLIGFVMVTRPRFFVARYVKTTTAQAPRRERPTQDDLAKVKPGMLSSGGSSAACGWPLWPSSS
jgi:hypothetical protein